MCHLYETKFQGRFFCVRGEGVEMYKLSKMDEQSQLGESFTKILSEFLWSLRIMWVPPYLSFCSLMSSVYQYVPLEFSAHFCWVYISSVSIRKSLISPSKVLRFTIKRYNLRLQTVAEWMSQHVASTSHLPICLLSVCSLLSGLASLLNCTCLCLAWFLLYSWTNILTIIFELGLQVFAALYHT